MQHQFRVGPGPGFNPGVIPPPPPPIRSGDPRAVAGNMGPFGRGQHIGMGLGGGSGMNVMQQQRQMNGPIGTTSGSPIGHTTGSGQGRSPRPHQHPNQRNQVFLSGQQDPRLTDPRPGPGAPNVPRMLGGLHISQGGGAGASVIDPRLHHQQSHLSGFPDVGRKNKFHSSNSGSDRGNISAGGNNFYNVNKRQRQGPPFNQEAGGRQGPPPPPPPGGNQSLSSSHYSAAPRDATIQHAAAGGLSRVPPPPPPPQLNMSSTLRTAPPPPPPALMSRFSGQQQHGGMMQPMMIDGAPPPPPPQMLNRQAYSSTSLGQGNVPALMMSGGGPHQRLQQTQPPIIGHAGGMSLQSQGNHHTPHGVGHVVMGISAQQHGGSSSSLVSANDHQLAAPQKRQQLMHQHSQFPELMHQQGGDLMGPGQLQQAMRVQAQQQPGPGFRGADTNKIHQKHIPVSHVQQQQFQISNSHPRLGMNDNGNLNNGGMRIQQHAPPSASGFNAMMGDRQHQRFPLQQPMSTFTQQSLQRDIVGASHQQFHSENLSLGHESNQYSSHQDVPYAGSGIALRANLQVSSTNPINLGSTGSVSLNQSGRSLQQIMYPQQEQQPLINSLQQRTQLLPIESSSWDAVSKKPLYSTGTGYSQGTQQQSLASVEQQQQRLMLLKQQQQLQSSPNMYGSEFSSSLVSSVSPSAIAQPSSGASDAGKASSSVWSEHTAPSGTKYYYNSSTKESTYEKPVELGGAPKLKKVGTPTAQSSEAAVTVKLQWKAYNDEKSGKTYYSDGVNSSWTKPSGFDDGSTPSTTSGSVKVQTSSSSSDSTPKKSKKHSTAVTYASKEEASAAFRGLLLSKSVAPTTKWTEVVRLCSSDPRWQACKTVGERKQTLAEYQTKRANEEKEQKRLETQKSRVSFREMLAEILLPSLAKAAAAAGATGSSSGIDYASVRYADARDQISKDDRYYAIDDEQTRQELFYDFMEEREKREERIRQAKKKAAKDGFLRFLKEKEDGGTLVFSSTWASFRSTLTEKDMKDQRFAVSDLMTDLDRQVFFADYVTDLQAVEEEKRRRIRDTERRAEKAQRDAYREYLSQEAIEGRIGITTRWTSVEVDVINHSSYGPVMTQDRDAPKEIFEDFVEDLRDSYRRDKSLLIELLALARRQRFAVTGDTTYDSYRDALLAAAGSTLAAECKRLFHVEPVPTTRLIYHELLQRAVNGAASALRGRRRGDDNEDEGEIVEEGEVEEN